MANAPRPYRTKQPQDDQPQTMEAPKPKGPPGNEEADGQVVERRVATDEGVVVKQRHTSPPARNNAREQFMRERRSYVPSPECPDCAAKGIKSEMTVSGEIETNSPIGAGRLHYWRCLNPDCNRGKAGGKPMKA